MQSGSIRRVALPIDGKIDRVVVYVQDIHQNLEAQMNIQKTVEALLKNDRIGLVGLEGAFTSLPLDAYRSYPNPPAVRSCKMILASLASRSDVPEMSSRSSA